PASGLEPAIIQRRARASKCARERGKRLPRRNLRVRGGSRGGRRRRERDGATAPIFRVVVPWSDGPFSSSAMSRAASARVRKSRSDSLLRYAETMQDLLGDAP